MSKSVQGLVSVVIPTYNRARRVAAAVASALAQTYSPIEVIVIDDGSTDDTEAELRTFGSQIVYVKQANAGVASARNKGLVEAQGEFIALLDSDDVWYPWKIEAQVATLERRPDVGMVWTDMDTIDDDGQVLHRRHLKTYYRAYQYFAIDKLFFFALPVDEICKPSVDKLGGARFWLGDLSSAILMGNLVLLSTAVLRRSLFNRVGEFDPTLDNGAEDYNYFIRLCQHGPVGFLDVPSILYRIGGPDQLTHPSRILHLARYDLAVAKKAMQHGSSRLRLGPQVLRKRLAGAHAWMGSIAFDAGRFKESREHSWQAIRNGHKQPRILAYWLLSFLPNVWVRIIRARYRTIKTGRFSKNEIAHS